MKNIFLAFLLFAGTTVMAQSGSMKSTADASASVNVTGKAELQKSLNLTDAEADKVWDIQQKYCGPDAKVNTKSDASSKKETASMDKVHEAYYAALIQVIPAEKADKLMQECKMSCDMDKAKTDSKSAKSCCPGGSAEKKSCSEKK